jgi:hypothetical protein
VVILYSFVGSIVNLCNCCYLDSTRIACMLHMHESLGGAFPRRHRANCSVITIIRKVPILGRYAWCLVFLQKSNFHEKIPENTAKFLFYQKTHGARIRDGWGATRGPHHLVARARPGRARGWCGRPRCRLDPSFRLHIPFDLKGSGVQRFSQIEFRCAATTRNRDSEPETLFWHPAGTGIGRRSSSSPTSLHQPSMIPPSMCE